MRAKFIIAPILSVIVVAVQPACRDSERVAGDPEEVAGDRSAFRFNPEEVDFGEVIVGAPVTIDVIASNTGPEPMMLTRLGADAPFLASAFGVRFGSGVAKNIPITFNPKQPGLYIGTLALESDSFGDGVRTVPLRGVAVGPPDIALQPRSLSFGAVAVGATGQGLIVVANRGTSVLEVVARAGAPAFIATPASLSVEPGQTEALEVRFRPEYLGEHTEILWIHSNQPGRSKITVPLNGTGVDRTPRAAIDVQPVALAFGKVRVGATAERLFKIRNRGGDPLNITSITFEPPLEGPTRSRTIAPSAVMALPVTCRPIEAGSHLASIVISSNAAGAERVVIVGDCEGEPDTVTAHSETLGGPGVGNDRGGPLAPESRPSAPESGAEAEVSEAAPEPTDEVSPSSRGSGLLESSNVYLASFTQPISDVHIDRVTFDPGSRWLEIRGLQLPTVDGGLNGWYAFDPVTIDGPVSSLGDFEARVPVTFRNQDGVPTHLILELTTDTATAIRDSVELAFPGRPLEGDRMRVVGAATIPDGPLAERILRVTLDVRVK